MLHGGAQERSKLMEKKMFLYWFPLSLSPSVIFFREKRKKLKADVS